MYDDELEPRPRHPAISTRALRDIAGLVLMVLGAAAACVGVGVLWDPWAGVTLAGVCVTVAGYLLASGVGE